MSRPALAPLPVILLLVFELGNCAQYSLLDLSDKNRRQWLDALHGNRDIAEFLQQQRGFARTEIAGDLFAPNWGAWNGVETNGGKAASVTVNVLDTEFFGQNGHRMWGVAYTVANKPDPNYGDDVFTGRSGLKVYHRRDTFPRAWSVHELVRVADRGENNVKIGAEFDAYRNRKATIVGTAPAIEGCDGAADKVELVEHLSDRITIRADLECTGVAVLSDVWFPGWRARVDHKLTDVLEVNGAMRGVVVLKGQHMITMRYRPVSVYLGAGLSLLGILAGVAVGVLLREHDRPGPAGS